VASAKVVEVETAVAAHRVATAVVAKEILAAVDRLAVGERGKGHSSEVLR
jgi:hypothetical protein